MMASKLKRVLYLTAVMSIVLLSGCGGQVQYKVEKEIDIRALLSSLRVGESTRDDVLGVLGTPNGSGRAMYPIDDKPRTLWFYYFEEGQVSLGGSEADVTILLVYFDGETYDGNLWSSTSPGVGVRR